MLGVTAAIGYVAVTDAIITEEDVLDLDDETIEALVEIFKHQKAPDSSREVPGLLFLLGNFPS